MYDPVIKDLLLSGVVNPPPDGYGDDEVPPAPVPSLKAL